MDDNGKIIRIWFENQCDKKYWADYFSAYGYRKLAIYGCGELGKYLARDLKNTVVKVTCFIDRRAANLKEIMGIPVYTLDDFLQNEAGADAIVVSVISADKEVLENVLQKNEEMPVMSLRDMVYEL